MRLFSLKTRRISAWVTTLALALSTFLPGGGLILSAQAASGLTWQASADTMDGTPNSWVRDLTQDSSGNLYAVAGDDKVYKSSDKGLNWSALTPGVGTSPTYYAVVKINSRLFVGG